MGCFFFEVQQVNEHCETITKIFKAYEIKDLPNMSDVQLPSDIIENIEIHYMIYTLCNGDITRRPWIESNLDVTDYIEWTCFKQFDTYQESELNKRYSEQQK